MDAVDLVTGRLFQSSMSKESDLVTGWCHPQRWGGEEDKGGLRMHGGTIETCRISGKTPRYRQFGA